MKIRGTLFLKIKFTYRYGDNDDVSGPVVFLQRKNLYKNNLWEYMIRACTWNVPLECPNEDMETL